LLSTVKGSVRFLSEEERERLLAETAKDPQLHVFTILALATASHAGEALRLLREHRESRLSEDRVFLLYTRQSPQKLKVLREHALIESAVSSMDRMGAVAAAFARILLRRCLLTLTFYSPLEYARTRVLVMDSRAE
jgi:phosphate uptake regulator